MGILKTFILISVYKETFIGKAEESALEKGYVLLKGAGMVQARIKVPKWGPREIYPIGKKFKQYSVFREKIISIKKLKNCIRYSLASGEELLLFT